MRGHRSRSLMGRVGRSLMAALLVSTLAAPLAASAAPARQDDEQLTIAFSVPGLNFPFFVHMMELARQEAEAIGNIEFIELDGENSATKQTADMEAMITRGVDGIVISPIDVNAMVPALEDVVAEGIPVVTVDRGVAGVDTLAHVGADNVRGGELQGEYVLEILPEGGEIFELLGQPGASPAIDRDRGLKNVIEAQEAVEIVFEQTANFDRAQALTVVETGLSSFPNPDAIVAANDDMAFGAVEAVQAAGIEVPIVGFDALPEALVAIQEGAMAATIEQFPGGQASLGLQILVDHLRDGTTPEDHDTFIEPLLITADNVGEAERAAEAGIEPAATPEPDESAAAPASLLALDLSAVLPARERHILTT